MESAGASGDKNGSGGTGTEQPMTSESSQSPEDKNQSIQLTQERLKWLSSYYSGVTFDLQCGLAYEIKKSLERQGADVTPGSLASQTLIEMVVPQTVLEKSVNPGPIPAETYAIIDEAQKIFPKLDEKIKTAEIKFKMETYKLILHRCQILQSMMRTHIDVFQMLPNNNDPEIRCKYSEKFDQIVKMHLELAALGNVYRDDIKKLMSTGPSSKK